ncbi:MAG TPA: hypothetical protein VK689_22445 [Armatimonadota bacterium]|nr:hypothetical protein [Armatimonadota bacterium]
MLSLKRRRFLSLLLVGATLIASPLFIQQPAAAQGVPSLRGSYSGTFTELDGEGNPTGETGNITIRIKRERTRRGARILLGSGQFGNSGTLSLTGAVVRDEKEGNAIALLLFPRRPRRGQPIRSYTIFLTEESSGSTFTGEYAINETVRGNPEPTTISQGNVTLQRQ